MEIPCSQVCFFNGEFFILVGSTESSRLTRRGKRKGTKKKRKRKKGRTREVAKEKRIGRMESMIGIKKSNFVSFFQSATNILVITRF